MAVRRAAKRRKVRFDAAKVFTADKSSDDLDFDLEREAAQYRATKGEGGNRSPPKVPPSDSGAGTPWNVKRLTV